MLTDEQVSIELALCGGDNGFNSQKNRIRLGRVADHRRDRRNAGLPTNSSGVHCSVSSS